MLDFKQHSYREEMNPQWSSDKFRFYEHKLGDASRFGTVRGGIYMASTVPNSCRVWNAQVSDRRLAGRLGSVDHLIDLFGKAIYMPAHAIFWLTDTTPHEAVPQAQAGPRQFFRLVTSELSAWYPEHSTHNPLGCMPGPGTAIRKGNKFGSHPLSTPTLDPWSNMGVQARLKLAFEMVDDGIDPLVNAIVAADPNSELFPTQPGNGRQVKADLVQRCRKYADSNYSDVCSTDSVSDYCDMVLDRPFGLDVDIFVRYVADAIFSADSHTGSLLSTKAVEIVQAIDAASNGLRARAARARVPLMVTLNRSTESKWVEGWAEPGNNIKEVVLAALKLCEEGSNYRFTCNSALPWSENEPSNQKDWDSCREALLTGVAPLSVNIDQLKILEPAQPQ